MGPQNYTSAVNKIDARLEDFKDNLKLQGSAEESWLHNLFIKMRLQEFFANIGRQERHEKTKTELANNP